MWLGDLGCSWRFSAICTMSFVYNPTFVWFTDRIVRGFEKRQQLYNKMCMGSQYAKITLMWNCCIKMNISVQWGICTFDYYWTKNVPVGLSSTLRDVRLYFAPQCKCNSTPAWHLHRGMQSGLNVGFDTVSKQGFKTHKFSRTMKACSGVTFFVWTLV